MHFWSSAPSNTQSSADYDWSSDDSVGLKRHKSFSYPASHFAIQVLHSQGWFYGQSGLPVSDSNSSAFGTSNLFDKTSSTICKSVASNCNQCLVTSVKLLMAETRLSGNLADHFALGTCHRITCPMKRHF